MDIRAFDVEHLIGKWLKPSLFCNSCAGAALGLVWQIQILELRGDDAFLDLFPELFGQCSSCADGLENCGFALFHLRVNIYIVLDFSDLRIVKTAGFLLTVATDKWYSSALFY